MSLEELLELLKEKGLRLTPQRQLILAVLIGTTKQDGQPLSAEEILVQVHVRYPGVSLDTVYRTLSTLKKAGLVTEVNFRDDCRRFELTMQGEHHHHLVCMGCGTTCEVPFCPVDYLARVQASYPDFEIEDHSFTLYGYCKKCSRRHH